MQKWIDKHGTWKSPATVRGVTAIVLAAFNRTDEMIGITNPVKGLIKPKSEPRLESINPDEEQAMKRSASSATARLTIGSRTDAQNDLVFDQVGYASVTSQIGYE